MPGIYICDDQKMKMEAHNGIRTVTSSSPVAEFRPSSVISTKLLVFTSFLVGYLLLQLGARLFVPHSSSESRISPKYLPKQIRSTASSNSNVSSAASRRRKKEVNRSQPSSPSFLVAEMEFINIEKQPQGKKEPHQQLQHMDIPDGGESDNRQYFFASNNKNSPLIVQRKILKSSGGVKPVVSFHSLHFKEGAPPQIQPNASIFIQPPPKSRIFQQQRNTDDKTLTRSALGNRSLAEIYTWKKICKNQQRQQKLQKNMGGNSFKSNNTTKRTSSSKIENEKEQKSGREEITEQEQEHMRCYRYGLIVSLDVCLSNMWHGLIEFTWPLFTTRFLQQILNQCVSVKNTTSYNPTSDKTTMIIPRSNNIDNGHDGKSGCSKSILSVAFGVLKSKDRLRSVLGQLLASSGPEDDSSMVLLLRAPQRSSWGMHNGGCPTMNYFPYGFSEDTLAGWMAKILFASPRRIKKRGEGEMTDSLFFTTSAKLRSLVPVLENRLNPDEYKTKTEGLDGHVIFFDEHPPSRKFRSEYQSPPLQNELFSVKNVVYGMHQFCGPHRNNFPRKLHWPYYVPKTEQDYFCSWTLDVMRVFYLSVLGLRVSHRQRSEVVVSESSGTLESRKDDNSEGGASRPLNVIENPFVAVSIDDDEVENQMGEMHPAGQQQEEVELLLLKNNSHHLNETSATAEKDERRNNKLLKKTTLLSEKFSARIKSFQQGEDQEVSIVESECPTVLFIDRQHSDNGRSIVEFQELMNFLSHKIFVKSRERSPLPCLGQVRAVRLENNVTLGEQVTLMLKATIVIGARGMGLVNALYLRPGAGLMVLSGRYSETPKNSDGKNSTTTKKTSTNSEPKFLPVNIPRDNYPWYPFPLLMPHRPALLMNCPVVRKSETSVSYRRCLHRSINFCDISCDVSRFEKGFMKLWGLVKMRAAGKNRNHSKLKTEAPDVSKDDAEKQIMDEEAFRYFSVPQQ